MKVSWIFSLPLCTSPNGGAWTISQECLWGLGGTDTNGHVTVVLSVPLL
jgi:hypothetical protein